MGGDAHSLRPNICSPYSARTKKSRFTPKFLKPQGKYIYFTVNSFQVLKFPWTVSRWRSRNLAKIGKHHIGGRSSTMVPVHALSNLMPNWIPRHIHVSTRT